jgi:DNA-binding XRE family transcriptional regulator
MKGMMVKKRIGKENNVSIGEAALTMAIGIVVERASRLPDEDKRELYELVKGLGKTKDPEEIEAVRVAMLEILDQEETGVSGLDATLSSQRPAKLQRWVEYVAAKVQELRTAAGLTQVELSKKSDLPQSHISRIEKARLSPSRATLEKIAHALGKPVSVFDPSA